MHTEVSEVLEAAPYSVDKQENKKEQEGWLVKIPRHYLEPLIPSQLLQCRPVAVFSALLVIVQHQCNLICVLAVAFLVQHLYNLLVCVLAVAAVASLVPSKQRHLKHTNCKIRHQATVAACLEHQLWLFLPKRLLHMVAAKYTANKPVCLVLQHRAHHLLCLEAQLRPKLSPLVDCSAAKHRHQPRLRLMYSEALHKRHHRVLWLSVQLHLSLLEVYFAVQHQPRHRPQELCLEALLPLLLHLSQEVVYSAVHHLSHLVVYSVAHLQLHLSLQVDYLEAQLKLLHKSKLPQLLKPQRKSNQK